MPLVTIAIPTYQRAHRLRHAIESVLAQDYERLELIISDNASSDGTRELCESYAAECPWVRYVPRPVNVGATANFEGLRALVRGDYFLYLADDDWIDPGYVSSCVRSIDADPTTSLVAGRVYHHRGEEVDEDRHPITLEDPDPWSRVLGFCRMVRGNGVFYGVTPVAVDRRVPSLRNVLGGDMLRVMGLAYLGRVRTLEDVVLHRAVDGISISLANVASTLGLGRFQATAPQIALTYWIFRDIAFDSPVYADLTRWRRLRLGTHAGAIVFARFVPGAIVKFGRMQSAAMLRRLRAPALGPQAS